MRVINSIKTARSRHKDCKVIRRKGVTLVICKSNPKFKTRQGKPGKKKYY
jgi:large subunit ribosomal protein L36